MSTNLIKITKLARRCLGIGGSLAVLFAAVGLATHGCGVRQPKKISLPVGASVILKPQPLTASAAGKDHPTSNVRLVINLEGKLISENDDAELWVYEKRGDTTPLHKFSTRDLASMYKDSKCTSKLVEHLDNALKGDALFCNGAFDLNHAGFFVLKLDGGKKEEEATSFITDYYDAADDLQSIVLFFS
jgi:hypothetical protein